MGLLCGKPDNNKKKTNAVTYSDFGMRSELNEYYFLRHLYTALYSIVWPSASNVLDFYAVSHVIIKTERCYLVTSVCGPPSGQM